MVRVNSCEFVDRLLRPDKPIHEFTRINTNSGVNRPSLLVLLLRGHETEQTQLS